MSVAARAFSCATCSCAPAAAKPAFPRAARPARKVVCAAGLAHVAMARSMKWWVSADEAAGESVAGRITSTSAVSVIISSAVRKTALRGAAANAVITWPRAACPMSTEAPRRNARLSVMIPPPGSRERGRILFVLHGSAHVHRKQSHLQCDESPGLNVPRPDYPEDVAGDEPPETMRAPSLVTRRHQPGGQQRHRHGWPLDRVQHGVRNHV